MGGERSKARGASEARGTGSAVPTSVFLVLTLFTPQEPHILLLDEPTNNLDIETIDALCEALQVFNGGVVVVTHDARLIETCECQLWVVEKQGVTPWVAGFEDYKESLLIEMEKQMMAEQAAREVKLAAAAKKKADKLAEMKKRHKKE